MNKYGVEVSGPGPGAHKPKLSSSELLCQLKEKVEVTTLTSDVRPFSLLPWAAQLPAKQLKAELGPFRTCAVVSSAGSLRNSGLGKEIGKVVLCFFVFCCSFLFLLSGLFSSQPGNHSRGNRKRMWSEKGLRSQLHTYRCVETILFLVANFL